MNINNAERNIELRGYDNNCLRKSWEFSFNWNRWYLWGICHVV